MNIFYLHEDAKVAARWHCDKHVVKMIVETAQLLSTAHRVLDGDKRADDLGIYKAAYQNHPSAVWVRESVGNYDWAASLLIALLEEYTKRYGKTHKTQAVGEALRANRPHGIASGDVSEPPQCMPDEYKSGSAVTAYRTYYVQDKSRFAKWRHKISPPPPWWPKISGPVFSIKIRGAASA